MDKKPHHLIFEGAELAGKSWIMSQIYDRLEPKYNKSGYLLDGCHWFNCDVGVYGTPHGRPVIEHYLGIFEELKDNNLLVEKFYLSDLVYNRLHRGETADYEAVIERLKALGFKIILITFPEDRELLAGRIQDRLSIYPHYERILRDPEWYLKQQREYIDVINKSGLPYKVAETKTLPDQGPVDKILKWIGEK